MGVRNCQRLVDSANQTCTVVTMRALAAIGVLGMIVTAACTASDTSASPDETPALSEPATPPPSTTDAFGSDYGAAAAIAGLDPAQWALTDSTRPDIAIFSAVCSTTSNDTTTTPPPTTVESVVVATQLAAPATAPTTWASEPSADVWTSTNGDVVIWHAVATFDTSTEATDVMSAWESAVTACAAGMYMPAPSSFPGVAVEVTDEGLLEAFAGEPARALPSGVPASIRVRVEDSMMVVVVAAGSGLGATSGELDRMVVAATVGAAAFDIPTED